MRTLLMSTFVGMTLFFSTFSFADAGLPKTIEFLFSPPGPVTVATLGQIDLSKFSKDSTHSYWQYNGGPVLLSMGTENYEFSPGVVGNVNFQLADEKMGVTLGNIKQMNMTLHNVRMKSVIVILGLSLKDNIAALAVISQGNNVAYRGVVTSKY